ncbi:MAG: RNA polymerase sigma factor [Steroidobacteraceae bacterium]
MSGFATLAAYDSLLAPGPALAPVGEAPAAGHGATLLNDTTAEPRSEALDRFLAGVERKAYRIALAGLRHQDDALDAVQDAMLQLARAYSGRSPEEWKPLFYRILENRIRDMQRRRSVRGRVMAWLPWRREDEEDEADPIAEAPSPDPPPVARLEIDEAMGALEQALHALPPRQRQAFLLRNLEGLDVAQTAAAMGCSEGSVKTHYFRAVQALRARLGTFEIDT